MPFVGFRPTKARLVVEHARASVLVLKVVLEDDPVMLASGGSLGELAGVLRIREASDDGAAGRAGRPGIGSLAYVPSNGIGTGIVPAKFQVDVTMHPAKFAQLLRAANAGRMPTRFMVDAGGSGRGLAHRVRGGQREKTWDNVAARVLPVTNFVMILPLDLAAEADEEAAAAAHGSAPEAAGASWATNAQMAEMLDEMLTFQSDTRNTMFGLVCVLGVVALAALALGVAMVFR